MSAAWLVCGLVPAKHMLCSMPFKCCLTHRLTQTCIQDHDCTLHIYMLCLCTSYYRNEQIEAASV